MERLKDEFVSKISHEIRSPLTIANSALSNLLDGIVGKVTTKQAEVITMASKSLSRLGRIINDLLDVSRLESGRAQLNFRCLELSPLLTETVSSFQIKAKQAGIKLEFEERGDIPTVYADTDLMIQVISNLLDNALRYARFQVSVRLKESNGGVEVIVSNDGPGIRKEDRKKIFNRFEQVDRPGGRGGDYKGTGLGLSICHDAIEQHLGYVRRFTELWSTPNTISLICLALFCPFLIRPISNDAMVAKI